MESNPIGATLKIQLQPFQTTEKDISNTLFMAVKDNMSGCVRHMVEEIQGDLKHKEAIVKFYVGLNGPKPVVQAATAELDRARFYTEVYDV